MPTPKPTPPYLAPYAKAALQHGGNFETMLWTSTRTQGCRFDAMMRLCDFNGLSVLDVGCGRADLYDYLVERGVHPSHYYGLEGLPEMAASARDKKRPAVSIIEGDFVRQPELMRVGAQAVVFSGSFNTIPPKDFEATLKAAIEAAGQVVVFNFLSTPRMAGQDWLYWRSPEEVIELTRPLVRDIQRLDDYLNGDCTLALWKSTVGPAPRPLP